MIEVTAYQKSNMIVFHMSADADLEESIQSRPKNVLTEQLFRALMKIDGVFDVATSRSIGFSILIFNTIQSDANVVGPAVWEVIQKVLNKQDLRLVKAYWSATT